jgi:hypothetical protein
VTRFAVLDDEDDDLDDLPLFQLSATAGLTEKIAQGLIAFLCGRTDRDMRASRQRRQARLRLPPAGRHRRLEGV